MVAFLSANLTGRRTYTICLHWRQIDLGLSFDPFSSSHLNLDKLFSLLTVCLWNLMFPLDVYNAFFMAVLLELTEIL